MVKSDIEVLAVIPARGGSKGIPGKNIKLLGGYPLIAYSIAAGLKSRLVSRTIVSTDDEKIAVVAREYGAEVPFMRPAEISQDMTEDLPVFEHAIRWFAENENYRPGIIVQLRSTSPFRPIGSVDEAVELLIGDKSADSVRTVTPSGEDPYKMWRIENDKLVPLLQSEFREPYNMPRQKLPKTYWQTGHIDAFRTSTVTEKHSLTGDKILPLVVDRQFATDLDNLEQWELAEWILAHRNIKIVRPD